MKKALTFVAAAAALALSAGVALALAASAAQAQAPMAPHSAGWVCRAACSWERMPVCQPAG